MNIGNKSEIFPQISVIVPCYNVELFLRKALDSIIQQTFKDIEIIVINDGSTDSSLRILDEISNTDFRIKVFSQENKGLSAARNLGIQYAQGKYIYFFDSDDCLDLQCLELCYQKCERECLDFTFFDADVFSDEHDLVLDSFNYRRAYKFEDKVYLGKEILYKQLVKKGYSSSACLLFINRNFLNRINLSFYQGIIHEDELFTFLVYLQANRVGGINQVLFHRRVRSASIMTTTFSWNNVSSYIVVCNQLVVFSKKHDLCLEQQKLIIIRIRMILLAVLYKTRNFSHIRKKVIKNRILEIFSYKKLGLRVSLILVFPFLLCVKKINIIKRIR